VYYKLEFTFFPNVFVIISRPLPLRVLHCTYKSTVAKLNALQITSYESINYLPLGFTKCSTTYVITDVNNISYTMYKFHTIGHY